MRILGAVGGGALVIVMAAGALLTFGMRTKNKRILGAVRRFNRAVTNRAQLKLAGRAGATMGLLHHRGRTSGKEYVTPLGPVPATGGFVFVLPYGPETDWLRNLVAAGSAELRFQGRTYRVDQPEVVPIHETVLAELEARSIRLFKLEQALQVRATEIEGEDGPAAGTNADT